MALRGVVIVVLAAHSACTIQGADVKAKSRPLDLEILSLKMPPVPTGTGTGDSENHFSWASFLGGVCIGVMVTLLVVGVVIDRMSKPCSPNKAEDPGPASSGITSFDRGLRDDEDLSGHEESLHLLRYRCGWLVGMLLLQSVSSLILDSFRGLMDANIQLAFFLTMLVGLGGNAGCQSATLTVRRIALGKETKVSEQLLAGLMLAVVLAPLAWLRAVSQGCSRGESIVIGISAVVITVVATTFGTALPKLLWFANIDPGHAAVALQVFMDIVGITLVCIIGTAILGDSTGSAGS